jgi:uncharacterized membrane protein (DUF485 family)
MLHEPAPRTQGQDKASAPKARLGLQLFIGYCVVYAGFVAINTLKPKSLEVDVLFGVNLAVIYGFGLIVLAIVMGLIYNAACTRLEDRLNRDGEGKP